MLIAAGLTAAPYLRAACSGPPQLQAKPGTQLSAKAVVALGDWFNDHRQFGCAAEAFARALEMEPRSAHVAYLLGRSLYFSGNAQAAVDALRQSVEIDSKVLLPHLILGAALEQMKNSAEAEIEWRAALAIDPKSTTALRGLSKNLLAEKDYSSEIALLRTASGSAPLTPDLTLDLAMAYSQMGMLPDAIQALRNALRVHPSSLPLAKALAGMLVLQARREEAAGILETAMKRHPADMGVQLLYLRILVLQDESAKAQQLGKKLLALAPHNWEVLYLNGVLERKAGQYSVAREHLEQAAALNPDHYESHRNLGSLLAQLKDAQGAKEELEKAIALGGGDPEVRFELAGVLRTLGEDEEAEKQLRLYHQEAQAKSDLTQAAAKAAFADQKLAAGNVKEAVDLYREALAAAPKEASLAYKLAMALDRAGDIANERTALEQAVQIDPGMAEAQNQLGYLASRAGDAASAEEHFRLAVGASRGFTKAWVNLAAILYLESKLPEAKAAVEQALRLEPGNPQAQKLSKQLDSDETHSHSQ